MLTPGTLLGERYEIIEKIGAGGMSIVYKAKDNRLQRYVAIKELREEFVQDEEFVARFRKEALSAASLSHPNIVGIYDVGSDKEIHYIVMEYVEGRTLKEVIAEQGPFDAKMVLELGVQMVSALKHAHQKKIIHRDIKPQNILMTTDGVLKVTDFGIAKAVDSSTIVTTGNAVGSVHYFSPEQAKGKYVNESSDLYSCGIVLFELATKRLPFEADSHISIALKHINEEFPKPSSFNPQIPENLENIILRATCKNQADRYQNADEMLRDMRGVLQNPSYKVHNDYFADKTILLSAEEMQLLRESETSEQIDKSAGEEDELMRYQDEDKNIYEENPLETKENDEEEIPKLYKVLVSIGGVLMTLALVVVITLALVVWVPGLAKSKDYSVPNVIDKTQTEAETLIRKNNLKVRIVEVVTNQAEEGIVIDQDPASGTTVKKGSTVEIQVAKANDVDVNNQEEVSVPDLSGLTITEITTELSKLGLQAGEIEYEPNETIEFGILISQSPSAKTKVKAGTKIDLVISDGNTVNNEINVPNLYGMTENEARSTLGGMNLSLGKITKEESEELEGTIIRQSVAVDSAVSPGTKINVTISTGPKEETIQPEEPTPEPEEVKPEDEKPDEIVPQTTKSITINLPDGEAKEMYRLTAQLTLDNGKTVSQEYDVSYSEFPKTISFEGAGSGVVDVYIDGVYVSHDAITF